MNFLVIDDSAVDRHLVKSLLEEMGHEVESISSTDGALKKVSEKDYAAIILDIVMPHQDGFKFLREIRLEPKTEKQYVILCSSKKTPLEIDYGIRRAGANDYIVKPATRESIELALEKL